MMTSKFAGRGIYNILPSSKSLINCTNGHSTVRHDGDILFYATLSVVNAVVGSRYRAAIATTNVELAKGEVASANFDLTNLPVYENPMLIRIDIRKSSSSPKCQPYTSYAYLKRIGSSVFVSQQEAIV